MTSRIRTGYAICTVPRSGSNWVGQLLESTGMLGRPLEYFNIVGRRRDDPAYPDDPVEQVARIFADGTTPNGIYGVKVFPTQVDAIADRVRWTHALPDLRFVHLRRRDLIGQALSLYRARETNQYRAAWEQRGAVAFDGDGIVAALRDIVHLYARWDAFFSATGIEPVRLVYEDVVEDPQSAVDAVADVVELGTHPPVDFSRIDLTVQRDEVSALWRARLHAEFGDHIDPV